MTARVTILPSGVVLDVDDGETVAEAAWRQNHVWPTKCWGQAECMACFTTIVDGELDAVPAETQELDEIRLRLGPKLAHDPRVRLGCRLTCRGRSLVLEKKGFRPAPTTDEPCRASTDEE